MDVKKVVKKTQTNMSSLFVRPGTGTFTDGLVLRLRRGEYLLVRMNISSVVVMDRRKKVGLKMIPQQSCPIEY